MALLLIKKDFLLVDGSPSGVTEGKLYSIYRSERGRAYIRDDDGHPHSFTVDGSNEFYNEHVEVIGRNVDDSD